MPSVSMDGTRRNIKRYRLEKLKENDTTEAFKSRLSNFREVEITNPEEGWQKFRDAVKETAEETIGMKTIYGDKKKCTPWWTENVRNAVKLKMKTFKKWMKTRQQLQDRFSYVEARNEAERVKRREKAGTWRRVEGKSYGDLETAIQSRK